MGCLRLVSRSALSSKRYRSRQSSSGVSDFFPPAPPRAVQAGVKSVNPVLSERYDYGNRLPGCGFTVVRCYTVVASLCAINSVNSRQRAVIVPFSMACE